MGWVGRLFDARDTFARMVLLDLSGVGYLVFGPQAGRTPTTTQWILAAIAFATALVCHRRPLVNLVGQTLLLAVAIILIDDTTINQVGASWALLELAMWARRTRTIWVGAGLLAAVDLTGSIGDPFPRLMSGVYGLGVVVGLPVLLGLVIRTTRELARRAEERAAEEQRRRESEDRAARADERTAIARELHDVVAHHVASMVLRIGVARHVIPDLDPRVGEVFDDVHGTGAAALTDLRRLVEVLRNPEGVPGDAALTAIEPTALPAALGAAVDRARQAGVIVEAEIDPTVGSLDAVRGLAVLRLTQEALTNVAKHAGPAAVARLSVAVVDGAVRWEVCDNGRGSTPPVASAPPGPSVASAPPVPSVAPAPSPGGGHGVTGMRERVEVLGGQLLAGPTGSGWRVSTVLPAAVPATPPSPAAPPTPAGPAAPAGPAGSGAAASESSVEAA